MNGIRIRPVALSLALLTGACLGVGCIDHKPDGATTREMANLPSTNPYYWLDQPAVATVSSPDYDAIWNACDTTARDYLYTIDRHNYRTGFMTTLPMISKQLWEPWRHDAGTLRDTWQSTWGTIQRLVQFQIQRNDDGTFSVQPKVLIERQSILERRITSVDEYHLAFAGPEGLTSEAVSSDQPSDIVIPAKYWTPIGRDFALEQDIARRIARHSAPGKDDRHARFEGARRNRTDAAGDRRADSAAGAVVAAIRRCRSAAPIRSHRAPAIGDEIR